MMALAQMEAIAADLADLGARVSELENEAGGAGGGGGDTIAVPTNVFIGTGNLTLPAGWDSEAGYVPGNVATYFGRTWVNIAEVKPKPANLTGPATIEETPNINNFPIAQYINNGERIEGRILHTDKRFARFTAFEPAGIPCKVFKFKTPNLSKITLPKNSYPGTNLSLHFDVIDSQGHEILGNFESFAASTLTSQSTGDKTIFYLVVYAVVKNETAPAGSVPFTLLLSSSGELVAEPHNTPPPEDPEHWAQLPGTRFNEPATTAPAENAEVEASPTLDALVTLSLLVPVTVGAEAAEYAVKEVGGAGVTFGAARIVTSTTITQKPTITFALPAGRKYKVEKVAGPALTSIAATTTLLS